VVPAAFVDAAVVEVNVKSQDADPIQLLATATGTSPVQSPSLIDVVQSPHEPETLPIDAKVKQLITAVDDMPAQEHVADPSPEIWQQAKPEVAAVLRSATV